VLPLPYALPSHAKRTRKFGHRLFPTAFCDHRSDVHSPTVKLFRNFVNFFLDKVSNVRYAVFVAQEITHVLVIHRPVNFARRYGRDGDGF